MKYFKRRAAVTKLGSIAIGNTWQAEDSPLLRKNKTDEIDRMDGNNKKKDRKTKA